MQISTMSMEDGCLIAVIEMITPNYAEKNSNYWKEHESRKRIEEMRKKEDNDEN